ncbi:Ser/Thr protein kinase RdoA involved in Cpx stress response, MazF antagonist [Micromonospora matsumotoense]|uniref:Ser/Thr protein kinase RdoA involved in Cpx stress response, MazF antagonist n=1 Tax=Micromonospora matsumotoense TaxID=121616 RepID=A0A1C5AGN2_9ACTN|nr:aminoglycoside phosphotransferase family protein [Micromonospora matsumotoense]SCF44375.1 Ser/Thr protein kinase RdoA involved in Cpx stress response, MazF antagonist [Micromonospora matsumotoense]
MSGRFSEEAMTAAMREVAASLGVSSEDAQLLRLTNNAVFALPTSGIVIRIARTHRLRDRVAKVVRLARWFADIDAPTIRLAPGVEQPVEVGTLAASVWEYLPAGSPTPTVEDLGLVLREFHSLGLPPFPLPAWEPVADARKRLADADGIGESDRGYLTQWCDRLEPQIDALNQRTQQGLIHGDAHVSNLLREPSDRVFMCDFDATCVGPRQVDLAAVAVGQQRFGRTGAQESLAATYGQDVTSDPSWPLLREARELKMIVAAAPFLATSEEISAEFDDRLRSIRESNHRKHWKPFADLAKPGSRSPRSNEGCG